RYSRERAGVACASPSRVVPRSPGCVPAPGQRFDQGCREDEGMFGPVPREADFPALEAVVLRQWQEHRVFERSMAEREGATDFVFYEGPPTANGRPGLHHVWTRVFKDLFCRYQTMRGHRVLRRAGWDTHGLPVEVQVERALGL